MDDQKIIQEIGNKYVADCELNCILCGTDTRLIQVAHRNNKINPKITGYMFFCQECYEKANGYAVKFEKEN